MSTVEERLAEAEDSLSKIHAALPALFAFRDNHLVWLKESGVFDVIVQEVLALVPKPAISSGEVDAMRSFYADLYAKVASRVAALESAPVANSTTSPGDVDVLATLASYDIHITPGKLGIGMVPDADYDASLQLGGNVSAEILGVSNTRGTDAQNPGEVHKNVISVAGNDGGLRLLQNLGWGPKGKIRTTLNRRASILALDSQGDLCKSTEEVGATSDYGQSWYIRTSGSVVEFCTYKVGGFIRILKSTVGYGATDQAQL